MLFPLVEDVSGTVDSKSALKSAVTLMSRVRAPPQAPSPDGGSESVKLSCCGLAIYNNQLISTLAFCYRFVTVSGQLIIDARQLLRTPFSLVLL
ncbi:hypothetical protein PoB_002864600 [Plakobranchus ocellatus]|uniref:Uncharacterized protein n=1 Tax=Plakobranchus ocellatus TaxID=259542 RepID=A0AAV3ZSZ9_9GAST|nr:hypothetical protein PoB_002864600 [Plakobranchus ocellatus]